MVSQKRDVGNPQAVEDLPRLQKLGALAGIGDIAEDKGKANIVAARDLVQPDHRGPQLQRDGILSSRGPIVVTRGAEVLDPIPDMSIGDDRIGEEPGRTGGTRSRRRARRAGVAGAPAAAGKEKGGKPREQDQHKRPEDEACVTSDGRCGSRHLAVCSPHSHDGSEEDGMVTNPGPPCKSNLPSR